MIQKTVLPLPTKTKKKNNMNKYLTHSEWEELVNNLLSKETPQFIEDFKKRNPYNPRKTAQEVENIDVYYETL